MFICLHSQSRYNAHTCEVRIEIGNTGCPSSCDYDHLPSHFVVGRVGVCPNLRESNLYVDVLISQSYKMGY